MSGEGERMEEARNVVLFKNELNITYLSGEVSMESVGSPEEEVKMNSYVPAPHINS